uniref:Uncharacterized protein n=1 Tax=Rhizophora mucronata TaxID=61149 RepID=A0A2P2NPU3_RHIMU
MTGPPGVAWRRRIGPRPPL